MHGATLSMQSAAFPTSVRHRRDHGHFRRIDVVHENLDPDVASSVIHFHGESERLGLLVRQFLGDADDLGDLGFAESAVDILRERP
jgi:hypothetical protein